MQEDAGPLVLSNLRPDPQAKDSGLVDGLLDIETGLTRQDLSDCTSFLHREFLNLSPSAPTCASLPVCVCVRVSMNLVTQRHLLPLHSHSRLSCLLSPFASRS